ALVGALLQAREQAIDMLQPRLDDLAAGEEAAHHQVLGHRQVLEDPAPFRRDGDAAAHDVVGVLVRDVLALERDGALARARVAADRHQQRGLAGAVGADQGDDLALVDLDRYAIERLDGAIVGMDVVQLQHHSSPRYALMTRSSLRTCSGVPVVMGLPCSITRIRSDIPMIRLMSCSISSTATPNSRRNWSISCCRSRFSWGFRPAAGSSSISRRGLVIMQRAISSRRWCP